MTDEERRINCIHYEEGWGCEISPALKCDGGCNNRHPHFNKDLNADLKPKFKVGQTIKYIGGMNFYPNVLTISEIIDNQYWDKNGLIVPIKFQDKWELVEKTSTSVWHDVNEKPEEVREILIYNKRDCGDSFYIALYCSDSDKVYINSRWYSLSKMTKWAYLDELLKL